MSSATTQVLTARLPNERVNQIRSLARSYGVTVNDVVKAALNVALSEDTEHDRVDCRDD